MADEEKNEIKREISNLEHSSESSLKEDKMETNPEHHHSEHHSEHHHLKSGFKMSKLRIFQILTVALAIILVAAIGFSLKSGMLADKGAVAQKTVDYLNENFGTTATVKTVTEKNGIFELNLDIKGQETKVYVTKDGNMIFPIVIATNANAEQPVANETTPDAAAAATMTKSAKPTVELFVMTHCPYGTQIEKGMLPVAELLGDKIDFEIKWVYYAMHGATEVNEELAQYCIQTEMNGKYLDYLSCFLKDGNTTACLASTAIDTAALAKCVAATDKEFNSTNLLNDQSTWLSGRFPLVNIYKADNDKYQVGGSPTLVINGVTASAGRDSASILKAVCGAFTTAPAECSTELSAAAPAAGFGYEGAGSATAATCG